MNCCAEIKFSVMNCKKYKIFSRCEGILDIGVKSCFTGFFMACNFVPIRVL